VRCERREKREERREKREERREKREDYVREDCEREMPDMPLVYLCTILSVLVH
jgi:hypothetical protein